MRLHLDTVQLPTKTQLPYLFDQSLSSVKAEGVNAKCLEKKPLCIVQQKIFLVSHLT